MLAPFGLWAIGGAIIRYFFKSMRQNQACVLKYQRVCFASGLMLPTISKKILGIASFILAN
jgi:hypothetical protein